MSPSERSVEMLTNFGLTRNQAKVYLALAGLRLASVGQISKASKVRREDVYRTLPKLEKMGLAERILGKPIRIRATPVKEALSILVTQEEAAARERVSSLRTQTEEFLTQFARAPRLEVEDQANFALLPNRDSIMGKMLTMMKKAAREFDIVCSGRALVQFVHAFGEQVERLTQRGVRVRMVSDLAEFEGVLPKVVEDLVSVEDSIDLRYVDPAASHYLITDFKEALISTAAGQEMGEYPCLWTNSGSLVRVLQGDFENLWHNSVRWKSIETTAVPEKVITFMEDLRPTNHLIFVYDSPEAKHNILFNYLKVGLNRGEAVVYVATDETPTQVREAMKQFGIQVEPLEATGALRILGYEEVYIRDGQFNMTATMNLWSELYNEALKQGFKGLRVTGEMACFFKHNLIQELLDYEKALHRILDIPMIALCAYNASMLNSSSDPINLYTELARAHGTVLFTGLDERLGRMEIR